MATDAAPSATRGHAAKQSVANAAMLFSSDVDDPFASIGSIDEEAEEEAEAPSSQHQSTISTEGQVSSASQTSRDDHVEQFPQGAEGVGSLAQDGWHAQQSLHDPNEDGGQYAAHDPYASQDQYTGGQDQYAPQDPFSAVQDPYSGQANGSQYRYDTQQQHQSDPHVAQDPYAAYQPQPHPAHDPYAPQPQGYETHDPYAPHVHGYETHDPYAPQSQGFETHDPYASQQQQQAYAPQDPYMAQQQQSYTTHNSYTPQHQPYSYGGGHASQQVQEDPYAMQPQSYDHGSGFETHTQDSLALQQQGDTYAPQQQQDPYAVPENGTFPSHGAQDANGWQSRQSSHVSQPQQDYASQLHDPYAVPDIQDSHADPYAAPDPYATQSAYDPYAPVISQPAHEYNSLEADGGLHSQQPQFDLQEAAAEQGQDANHDPYAQQESQPGDPNSASYDQVSQSAAADDNVHVEEAGSDPYASHGWQSEEAQYAPPHSRTPPAPTQHHLAGQRETTDFDPYAPQGQLDGTRHVPYDDQGYVANRLENVELNPYAEQEQQGDQRSVQQQHGFSAQGSHGFFEEEAPYDVQAAPTGSAYETQYEPVQQQQHTSAYLPKELSIDDGAGTSLQHAIPDVARERRSAKIPLACFSIDGKLATYFPTSLADQGGDAYGLNGNFGLGHDSSQTNVTIRALSAVIPSTTYATSMKPLQFPGPLFEMGSGTQLSALGRATGASSASNKAKKAILIKHLQEAVSELASGLGYLNAQQSPESSRIEDRIVLVRILSAVLEHDGNMMNNPAFDKAVVNLLMADTQEAGTSPSQTHSETSGTRHLNDRAAPSSSESAAALVEIQRLLAHGQRSDAVALAQEKKLWTHAVVIASGMDKETWRNVVGAFMDEELDDDADQPLKVAYGLFSGQEPKAMYDLFRPKRSLNGSERGHFASQEVSPVKERREWRRSAAMIMANRTSGDMACLTAIGDGLRLAGWLEAAHVCYLLSLSTSNLDGHDGSGARLTLLGTHSPNASTPYLRDLDGIMLTEVLEFALSLRPVPKGGEPYQGLPHLQAYRIVHALLLAEMGESKKALKYCEAITSLLKAGKMNRYYHPVLLQTLQELSNRLSGDGKTSSPSSTGGSWAKKKLTADGVWGALENRFTKFIAGEDDDSGSGAGGTKPASNKSGNAVGAFTHYSAITPEATSRGVSRAQSYADFSNTHGGASSFPAQTPSNSSGTSYSRPVSRASSTLDVNHRSAFSPLSQAFQAAPPSQSMLSGARPPSSAATDPNFSDWPTSAGPSHHASHNDDRTSPGPMHEMTASSDAEMYAGPYRTHATRDAPWYASSNGVEEGSDHFDADVTEGDNTYGAGASHQDGPYYGYDSHGASKPQFVSNIDQDLSKAMDVEGFVSPMDALGGAPTPTFTTSYAPPPSSSRRDDNFGEDDDDDDLGLGNRRGKHRESAEQDETREDGENDSMATTPKASSANAANTQMPSDRAASNKGEDQDGKGKQGGGGELKQTSSWFGRFWSRGGTPSNEPKTVRAHMGEESSFYYDKELKRWVNKKTGDGPQAATPPPPPPRAATASPSMGRGTPSDGPPPQREAFRAVSSSSLSMGGGGGGGGPPQRSTPSISETAEEPQEVLQDASNGDPSRPPRPSLGGSTPGSAQRARSNLADHSQPPALQPSRPGSVMSETGAVPSRPPLSTTGTMKKKPISKRYVRVD